MNRLLSLVAFLFLLTPHLPGQEVLDEPVPWSGTLEKTTLKEAIARMTGWAEGSGKKGFDFTQKLSSEVANHPINSIRISNDPRPTYRKLLSQIFSEAKKNAHFARGRDGIIITYLVQRRFSIRAKISSNLKRTNKWSTEAITKEMKLKGWKFSNHLQITLFSESRALVVQGTQDDCDKVRRFLGY